MALRTIRATVWCGFLAAALLAHGQGAAQPRARAYAGEEGVLPSGRVMDAIGLKPGMKVGEAGAGWGYFTFVLAQRVGPRGVVYANDIDQAALAELDAYRQKRGDTNVRAVLGDLDDPLFPADDLDVIVIVDAFHDFE